MRAIASSEGGARPGRTGNEREGVGAEKEKREGRKLSQSCFFSSPNLPLVFFDTCGCRSVSFKCAALVGGMVA